MTEEQKEEEVEKNESLTVIGSRLSQHGDNVYGGGGGGGGEIVKQRTIIEIVWKIRELSYVIERKDPMDIEEGNGWYRFTLRVTQGVKNENRDENK